MSSYLGFQPSNDPNAFFVSYNTEDAQRIQPIVCKLQELGVPLWYDYGLEYGEKWSTQIAEHIDHCRAVVLFFSRDILLKENSFVRKEYQMAKDFYEKKVYVVLLDNIAKRDVPHHMVAWWIDILSEQNIVAYNTAPDEEFCRSLARAIGAQIPEPEVPAPTPAPALDPQPVFKSIPEPMPEPILEPIPTPEPAPQPKPTPASSIENWKLVLQRQQEQSRQAAQQQAATRKAEENWKQVLQKQAEALSSQPSSEPAATNWKNILKKAADMVKYDFLELPQEQPAASQGTWVCTHCNAKVSVNYDFCTRCYMRRGTKPAPLPKPVPKPIPMSPATWKCQNCSAENSTNYGQCKKCGTFRTD